MPSQLGFCTGDARFGAAYAAKCAGKDARTTSAALGFRVAGAQHWEPQAAPPGPWRRVRLERAACAALDAAGARDALVRFTSCGGADAAATAAHALLPRLAALADWLRAHRGTRFFGASVLLLYDAAPLGQAGPATPEALRADIKARAQRMREAASCAWLTRAPRGAQLVDFAHVAAAEGERDDNVLGGVGALISALEAAAGAQRHLE